jgi:hypothetical protein
MQSDKQQVYTVVIIGLRCEDYGDLIGISQ